MASSSRPGRRHDTGAGMAPSFQHPMAAARNSPVFRRAIVTRSPVATPLAANALAIRSASLSSSRRVRLRSSSVTAGRSGASLASRASHAAYETIATLRLLGQLDDFEGRGPGREVLHGRPQLRDLPSLVLLRAFRNRPAP